MIMTECKRIRTSKVWESFTKLKTNNAVVCNTCKAAKAKEEPVRIQCSPAGAN